MLRHLGMTRRQIARDARDRRPRRQRDRAWRSGSVLGFAISLILIHVVNRQSFHWGMELSLPWAGARRRSALLLLALSMATALGSGTHAMGDDVVRAREGRLVSDASGAGFAMKRRRFLCWRRSRRRGALRSEVDYPRASSRRRARVSARSRQPSRRFAPSGGTSPAGSRTPRAAISASRSRSFAIVRASPRRIAARFAPRQLLFAHAALADPRHGRLRHDQRAARAGFGLAEAARRTTRGVHRRLVACASPAIATPRKSSAREFAFDLAFAPHATGAAARRRRRTRARAADDAQASYYYSRPQLAVTGTVTLRASTVAVTGTAWLDHEWSSEYMAPEAAGWDWTGINLDDGGALMAFRMRDKAGSALWAGGTLRERRRSRAHLRAGRDPLHAQCARGARRARASRIRWR